MLISKAIKWAEQQGFSGIKAKDEEHETPTAFQKKGDEDAFVPDVTGVKLGTKSYIEVATKLDDVQRKISKWKLLSTLAGMKRGKLYLLAPRGHKAFTDKVVKNYNIEATVVSI